MSRKARLNLVLLFLIAVNGFAFSQDLSSLSGQDPFRINGSVTAKLQFYNTDRDNPSRSPFMWYLQGNPVITVYGIVLPFSFRFSEQERDFRQPFNQFGVSPYYKWAKLHLGYRSHNWSTYALAGHSITGVGLELTPGKFQVGFATGRLLKPVRYIDNPENIRLQTPAYKRTGTALRLGYGSESNNFSLVILKARDDSTSLGTVPSEYSLTPDENLVVSFLTKQTIAKKYLFEVEVAQSLYTKDIRTAVTDSTGGLMTKIFSSLIQNHESTTSSNAVRASAGYQSDLFSLMLRYQRVEPDFRSMGAYYFATDLSNITIEPTLKLMQKKLTLAGSLGTQVDNLKNDKSFRTRRTITSARINFVPVPQYSLSAFYSNYGLAQESGLLSIDTLRQSEVAQATSQIGVTQSLNLTGEKLGHNLMVNYNYQKLNDRNENTSQYSEFSTNILSANYFITYIPYSINGSAAFLYTHFAQDTVVTVAYGPSAGLGKSFLKNKLNASVFLSFINNKVQGEDNGTTGIYSFQLGYKPFRNHRFALKYNYSKNNRLSTGSNSYYESKLDFDYTYTF
ncbi:MAG: hypothetical protein RBT02_01255 [Bacteroidales bacterium]|jgi:hypothetical protein|nr:hypothetical protein [Bacteroidales bacterium]